MSDTENNYFVIVEYDKPLDIDYLLNYEAGVWYLVMTPGDVDVTDDNANTGYYPYTNEILYNIKSLRVDDENYSATESYADMLATNKSFYYDEDGTGAGSDLIGGEELYLDFSDSADMGKDYSAGGNDGTATDVTQVTGPFDKAAQSNGSTSKIELDETIVIEAGNEYTITGWLNVNAWYVDGASQAASICRGNGGASAYDNFIAYFKDRGWFQVEDNSGNKIFITGVDLSLSTDYFFAIEFKLTETILHIDGATYTSSSVLIDDMDIDVILKGYRDWSLDGTLSYFRIFPRILSDEERTSLYLYNKIKKPTSLYIHFDGWEPPLNRQIFAGGAVGYTYGVNDSYYYNNVYYEPLVSKIFNIKKNKDPLFFGLLKFQSGTVELINMIDYNGDGYFDDWRDRNLFAQACRLLVGQYGDSYADLEQKFTGNIEDDSRSWDSISIKLEDIRKGLTKPVADNLLNKTDYPDLNDDNVDVPKPVAYGEIFNAECINLNQEESGSPATYTFLICDTEFNAVDSLDAVYVDGGDSITPDSTDLANGTFNLTRAQLTIDGDFDESYEVTADFEVAINNGVSILKDLIDNYDGKPFLSTFWDITEVNTATSLARDTSLYIDDDKKLKDAVKEVSSDIDGLFFAKDNGKYTIRIYDANRTPTKTIYTDEWIDEPDIDNNASEFLTSAVIKYRRNATEDTYRLYENLDYKTETFARYKRYKKSTFKTGLVTEADAIDKSETILDFSSNVEDIVKRSTKWQNSDLEIMDFVICDPTRRYSKTDTLAIYEVVGIEKSFANMTVKFSLRYVKAYTPVITTYGSRITDDGSYRITSDGNTRIIAE